MKKYIIQEYNRKTKKYRDLGVILANTKNEAKSVFIKQSRWTGDRDVLLHVEDADQYKDIR